MASGHTFTWRLEILRPRSRLTNMAEIVGTVVAKVHELQSRIKAVSRLLWQDQENIRYCLFSLYCL